MHHNIDGKRDIQPLLGTYVKGFRASRVDLTECSGILVIDRSHKVAGTTQEVYMQDQQKLDVDTAQGLIESGYDLSATPHLRFCAYDTSDVPTGMLEELRSKYEKAAELATEAVADLDEAISQARKRWTEVPA